MDEESAGVMLLFLFAFDCCCVDGGEVFCDADVFVLLPFVLVDGLDSDAELVNMFFFGISFRIKLYKIKSEIKEKFYLLV